MDPIKNPDPTNTEKSYWENVLRSWNLSMNRGKSPQTWIDRGTETERRESVTNQVGSLNNLVGVEEEEFRKASGKVESN